MATHFQDRMPPWSAIVVVMTFLINPSGPVGRATIDNAYANMTALLAAAGVTSAPWRRNVVARESRGYFEFLADVSSEGVGREVEIAMPGCALELLQAKGLSAPRVYVRESSLWWDVAVWTLRDLVGVIR